MWWGRDSGAGICIGEGGLHGAPQGHCVPLIQDKVGTEEGWGPRGGGNLQVLIPHFCAKDHSEFHPSIIPWLSFFLLSFPFPLNCQLVGSSLYVI